MERRPLFAPHRVILPLVTAAVLLLPAARTTMALKHTFTTHADRRTLIGPVGLPFGFWARGHFSLTVYAYELLPSDDESLEAGFILRRFDNEASYNHYLGALSYPGGDDENGNDAAICAFDYFMDNDDAWNGVDDVIDANVPFEPTSAEHGLYLSMKGRNPDQNAASLSYDFHAGEEGLYMLTYQVCQKSASSASSVGASTTNGKIQSSFELDIHHYNIDSLGHASYLTAGEMHLGLLFLLFALSYVGLCWIWISNLCSLASGGAGHFRNPSAAAAAGSKPIVYAIHHLMSALLVLKFLSLLFESVRYHTIRVTGHAELWSFLYYTFTAIKGIFLFTVILLIGTGWSFVKPFLTEWEKKVVAGILALQVVNNIALAVLMSGETSGERAYGRWTAILHLVDILCCCAVLLPIVWQVNALEKSIGLEDENVDEEEREMALASSEKGEILTKLKLFRTFYLLVVAYIYATRILVYLFSSMLDYRHLWVQPFVIELVTLAFYVIVGLMFRPQPPANSYARLASRNGNGTQNGVHDDDDDAEEGIMLQTKVVRSKPAAKKIAAD